MSRAENLASKENRIAFLVGAGLVTEAGLPMSVGLAEELKRMLISDAADANLDPDQQKIAKLQLQALRFINGAIRFQEGVLDRDPDSAVNIEQIAVSALELSSRMKNPLAPYMSGRHQRIVELEQHQPNLMAMFVDFIYSRLEKWLATPQPKSIAYLSRIADFCDGEGVNGVDIFSLNYDLCIETALKNRGKKFANGFTEDGWEPMNLEKASPIRLYKLHGSLDWVEDRAYGLCALKFPVHKDAEDIIGDHPPLLIFGTTHKLTTKDPFLTLTYHFAQRVFTTNVLAIIGYSFGDEHVNQIIWQGLWRNSRLKIVLVSPRVAQLMKKVPDLEKNPKVRPIPESAMKALNENTLLDAVRQCLYEAAAETPF